MAGVITTAFTDQAKQDFLKGIHIIASHTFKIALIKSGSVRDYDKTQTAVGTPGTGAASLSNLGTDEVVDTNGGSHYTAGGYTLITPNVTLSTDTAILDFTGTDPSWTSASLSAIGAIVYNDTVSGKPAIAVLSFSGTVASTNGTFSITLPTPDASNGLIRIA